MNRPDYTNKPEPSPTQAKEEQYKRARNEAAKPVAPTPRSGWRLTQLPMKRIKKDDRLD